jgi:hypothetical protein
MTDDPILLNRIGGNYLACVYPFPPDLRPEHLQAPDQAKVFTGLRLLHQVVQDLYAAFTHIKAVNEKELSDENYCWKTLEGAGLILWTLGIRGEKVVTPGGSQMRVQKLSLDTCAPGKKIKDISSILPAMQATGGELAFLDADGRHCSGGWKNCDLICLGWEKTEAEVEALWAALRYFARRVDIRQPGIPFQAFQRVDFRSLLPGGNPATLPYTFEEALDTLDAKTSALWRKLADTLGQRYPQYIAFFRHPDLRRRSWVINYDTKAKGYGLFSLYGEEAGFRVRMAFKKNGRLYVLGHISELSPRMQEMFLERVTCIDCKHCGQHEYFTHGDHIHKLCAGAWFYSGYLEEEDLPSVERLIAIHVAHLS